MRAGRMMLGLAIICLSMVLFLNPIQTIHLVDNTEHTYIIPNNDTGLGDSELEVNFSFDSSYISSLYYVDGGRKVYHNYLNVYIEEYLTNTSKNISYYKLNDFVYTPDENIYHTSLEIIEGSLDNLEQNLKIYKDADLEISQLTLDYKGADYDDRESYVDLAYAIATICIIFGIFLCIFAAR